jgi:gas vesicle protein
MTDDKYPLYPSLTPEGAAEAQAIMDSFKPRITKMIEEVLDKLYVDVSMYVESDHWANYKTQLLDGFKGYTQNRAMHKHDFAELRQAIYKNHKEAIVEDLNQDLVEENERLKKQIKQMQEARARDW